MARAGRIVSRVLLSNWAAAWRNLPIPNPSPACRDHFARHCHGIAVGSLRRTDPRFDPHRRRARGRESAQRFLLLAYAAGAATSLAVALLAGGRVFAALKRSLGAEVWIRSILGVAVLAGVVVIALGLDRGLLTQVSLASTSGVEQNSDRPLYIPAPAQRSAKEPRRHDDDDVGQCALAPRPVHRRCRTFRARWHGSIRRPLNRDQLKGHVVLVDFWTYSCINCLRTHSLRSRLGGRSTKTAGWWSSESTRPSSPLKRIWTT